MTSPDAPFTWGERFRSALSPLVVVLTALSGVAAAAAAILAASDARGDSPWGYLMILAPSVPVLVAVIQSFSSSDHLLGRVMFRIVVFSGFVALLCGGAVWVASLTPFVTDAVAATAGEDGWHYWFGDETHPFLFVFLVGWIIAMVVGLATFVIGLVAFALIRPREFANANMYDLDRKYAERNRRAGIALSLLLVLVFLIPTLLVVGGKTADASDLWGAFANLPIALGDPLSYLGDLAMVVGALLIPVGLCLTWYVVRTQKVDSARRAAAGVPVGLDGGDAK